MIIIFNLILCFFSIFFFITSLQSLYENKAPLFNKKFLFFCALMNFLMMFSCCISACILFHYKNEITFLKKQQKFEIINEKLYRKK